MKHAKPKFKVKVLWITLSIVFGLLVIAYGVTVYYFSSHFGFNTSINDVDCTYMTIDEAEETIIERVDAYKISVSGRDGLQTVVLGKEAGMKYIHDDQVNKIFERQNPFLWFMPLFKDPIVATTDIYVNVDSSKIVTKLEALDLYNEKRMRPPVDAYTEFEGSQYVIRSEDLGSTLLPDRTGKALEDAMLVMAESLDLDEAGCYLEPEIYSDNPELNETVNTWNTYACFVVIYTFGDTTEILDATTTMGWIDIEADGTGTLNEDALEAWVRNFGARHDTIGTTRKFITATGQEVYVEGGDYGWEVDEEAEIEAIKEAYWYHTGLTREPYYVQRAFTHAAPGEADWGTTYLELDLTNQHIYYIVNTKIVFEADVVTGSPWGNRSTPQGVYYIKEMSSPAKLVGEIQADGRPEYETWVTYWMRMTWEGHGFHDANWQPWFGGDRYTYAGSHGCINMYYYDAEELFYLIEEGTPVISHY